MPKEKPERSVAPADGICRNDRKIQMNCVTARKVAQKVKGKHHPSVKSADYPPPEFL